MPKKFFRFLKTTPPKGKTKPVTRQYFSGESHFLNSEGRKYVASKGKNYDPRREIFDEKYVKKDGTLDMWKLRNAQKMGKVNEFPNKAGKSISVSFEMAIAHLRDIAVIRLKVNSLRFEVDMAKMAEKVFKESFSQRKFRTQAAKPWKPLAPYTVKQRARYGTSPSRILVDTGTLMKSITAVPGEGRVITDPRAYSGARRHKGVCYAGIHNDPRDFGATNVNARNHVVTQRQFMGHSSVLRDYGRMLFKIDMFDLLFTPIA